MKPESAELINHLPIEKKFHRDSVAISKPFLKWAGGKRQLIKHIETTLPQKFKSEGNFTYIEAFVGSGAIMFYLLKKYNSKIKSLVINDSNTVLISVYNYLKNDPLALISKLNNHNESYFGYSLEDDRKKYYLEQRCRFNTMEKNSIDKAAIVVFLNKTCYNGLYRVNSKNEFNVPFGRHLKPRILDEKTLLSDSILLQKAVILEGDFEETFKYKGSNTLFYFDPPYKPISQTSSFKSYSADNFGDTEQMRLKEFCDKITRAGNHFILSNSDLKNEKPEDNFFDDLYKAYKILRVPAKRTVNSVSKGRGKIFELLISNENHFSVW
jgi:DNA adenine methylase